MKTRTKLIVLGVSAYLIFLLSAMPASVLFKHIDQQVQAGAVSGTIWHGKASSLQAGILNLGDAEWNLRVLSLFIGRLAADVKLAPAKGFATGVVSVSLNGQITLSKFSASLPFDSIVGSGGLPGGWTGSAQIKLDELVIKNNWPVAAKGTVDATDITGPTHEPINIGNYRLTFPGQGSNETTLVGDLSDISGAAVRVNGRLTLSTGRSYQLDTLVAATPTTPESIVNGIKYLGEADAQGLRPFSVSGTM